MSEQVFIKIKELGRVNSKRDELQEFCIQQFDQIVKFIPRRILNSDGECLLDCILNGLPNNSSVLLKHKAKIVELVLKTMKKESTSLTHCGGVIGRLCLELPRMPVDDLVRWCNDCVQSIVDDTDINMIWRDVLPECISVLTSTFDTVKHCDTEMTSTEFKEQSVTTLCQCRWSERQLVQLVAMFKDMQLSKTSHKLVVNKICSHIIDIPPDTLPPLVHQLMKLCKTYNLEIVLAHLSNYFRLRLYSKLEPPPQDSESTTMDIDDIVPHSPAELSRCLSTCIYHISQGAVEPELIRKHIKMWPKTQLLRAPFIIDLALAISDKGRDFRSVCLDAIKSAIEQRVMDELRSKESAWVRSVLPPDVDAASVFKVLTAESANHQQLTVVGLIHLAFSLLAVSRVKQSAPACWSLGKLILVRLCRSQAETAPHVLAQLADRLATDCSLMQYSDCLYILCKLSAVSVERCSELARILESCRPNATYRPAATVLDAVHPLINFSTRTRDTLFMVCRKGLYSRDSQHRCLALSGFLTVLRYTRLSRNTFSSSQCSSDLYANSTTSYLTQLTVDFHATEQGATVASRVHNEAVCMEVVSILRRCLMQDASVKQLLYTSIYDCAKEKPALHECILEMFHEHLSKYLPEGARVETDPPLWDKCVQMSGATAVLTEPLPRLLYAISQFLQTTEEESLEDILASPSVDTASAHLKSTLNMTVDKLCGNEAIGNVDVDDLGLTDLTPESKAKCIKIQQMIQCFEALVAYKVMTWTTGSDYASTVYRLCKGCNQLLDLTKGAPKAKKKGSKSLNETKDTVKSQKSQKSQKENKKAPTKVGALVKDRAGPFKPLPCVWDVRFCLRILQLLYSEEVSWCSSEQRNQLIGRRDFHHWTLRCVLSALTEPLDRRAVTHLLSVATVLYQRCVCRFQSMCEFDDQTALSCLDLFKTCLTLLLSPTYRLPMNTIFHKITGVNDEAPISTSIAKMLEHIYTALMQIELENELEERDLMVKKLLSALIATATVLLEVPTHGCADMSNVIVKLEDYVRTSKQDWLALLPPLLTATCREQQEAQLLDELLTKLTAVLGRIDEEDTSAGGEDTTTFPYIDTRTGHTALSHVCAHLADRFRSVTHLLTRARDLNAALTTDVPREQRVDRELTELYKSIVVQLCQLTTWTSRCTKLRCTIGAGSDKVLNICVKLYSLLGTLAKQIDGATAQIVKFERLLKLSGKKLSSIMDNLITYIEASQTSDKRSAGVLRDTRLIPRAVLEAEMYCKHVLLRAQKDKLDWQQYLSLGTARDFRIKTNVLEEVLNARDRPDNDDTRDEDEAINDASTEAVSPITSEDDGVRRKKRRVS